MRKAKAYLRGKLPKPVYGIYRFIRMDNKRSILYEGKNKVWFRLVAPFYEIYSYEQGIPQHFLDFQDMIKADALAKTMIEEIYDWYARKNVREALNNIMGSEHGHLVLKKNILSELKNMVLSMLFARKAIERLGLKGKVGFFPRYFSPELYVLLSQKAGVIPINIEIPAWYLIYRNIVQRIKNQLNIVLLSVLPFLLILIGLFNRDKNTLKRYYTYGIYLRATDGGISEKTGSMDFLVRQGLIAREDVLFVVDNSLGEIEQEYLLNVKNSGYQYCYFKQMVRMYPLSAYLKNIYPILMRTNLVLRHTKPSQFYVIKAYLNVLKTIYSWEIFYARTQIGTFISSQEPGSIARALWQRRHGSENLFMYLSSTHHANSAIKVYYSMLVFDKLISSKIPVREFQEYGNFVEQYHDIGVINADVISKVKDDGESIVRIKNAFNVPEGKDVVAIFDDNSDTYDTYALTDILYFMRSVYKIIEKNLNCYFFFKPRVLDVFERTTELREALKEIISHDRCRLIAPTEPKCSAFDLIAVSKLVITVYSSSILTEALSSGVNAICFMPREGEYDSFWERIKAMPYVCARDHEELERYAGYWLTGNKKAEFSCLTEEYVKKYIDGYCDGRALSRLAVLLKKDQKYENSNTPYP